MVARLLFGGLRFKAAPSLADRSRRWQIGPITSAGRLKGPPSAGRRGNLVVALAPPTPTGIQDPSDEAPGRTQDMARPCSQICTRPPHGRVLYRVSVSHANDFPPRAATCGTRAHHAPS